MKYVVRIAFGPVQGFIAAARKTSDLKQGSLLLTEILGKMCEAIRHDVQFIFPHHIGAKAANILQFTTEGAPVDLAKRCKEAAEEFLQSEFTNRTSGKGTLLNNTVDPKQQIRSFLEFFAAWAEFDPAIKDGSAGGYQDAIETLNDRSGSRKALRDFNMNAIDPSKLDPVVLPPASPLLPEYHSVVAMDGHQVDEDAQKAFKLKPAECLDAISLTKRLRQETGPNALPSTREIAAATLLRDAKFRSKLEDIRTAAKKCFDECDIGDLLFGSNEVDTDYKDQFEQHLSKAKVLRKKHFPDFVLRPYYVVMHADGDSMGKALSRLTTETEHTKFSETLAAEFADDVETVIKEHDGELVFAGGDDVLAMLPLDTAIGAALAIRKTFQDAMANLQDAINILRQEEFNTVLRQEEFNTVPTISMGLAIVHITENLQSAVRLSEAMEKRAKDLSGKDALAVCAMTRGGSQRIVACKWDDPNGANVGLLDSIISDMAKGDAPRGFAYEVLNEARRLKSHKISQHWAPRGGYERIKSKKSEHKNVPDLPDWVKCADSLEQFGDMLALSIFWTRGEND